MRKHRRALAAGLLALVLFSFVSPFSYAPNPLGLHYLLRGNYRYDPHSPFVNRFATLGTPDPTSALTAKLDRLLGQTGLDPLDPQQPLVGYRVREITTGRPSWLDTEYAEASVEFRYAGGATRIYQIPVWQYNTGFDLSGTKGWRYTGLDRLFTDHLALPYLPFATADSAPAVGMPRPVASAPPISPRQALSWSSITDDPRLRLRPAPNGHSFLLHQQNNRAGGPLWLIALDGAAARAITDRALDAAWSADGRIAFLRCPDLCVAGGRFDLVVADPASGEQRTLGKGRARSLTIVGGVAYLLDDEALWRQPLDGGATERLAAVPGVSVWSPAGLAVAPDTARIAYACNGDLCLSDPSGTGTTRVGLGYPQPRGGPPGIQTPILPDAIAEPIVATNRTSTLASLGFAWSPDGSRLAIATGTYPGGDRGPELWIVDRAGRALSRLPIGPNGTTGEPTWTPDGQTILLNTFPRGGRRIVAIDVAAGRATDLSQPRWDTFASPTPDGNSLLLWNGRGGFWLAPLRWRSETARR